MKREIFPPSLDWSLLRKANLIIKGYFGYFERLINQLPFYLLDIS